MVATMLHAARGYPKVSKRGSGQCDGKSKVRKRKSHKNSRSGCANCKLRSVKCDEGKPSCKKCQLFGVRCGDGSKSPDTLFVETSFQVHFTPVIPESPSVPMPLLGSVHSLETYQLALEDMDLVEKFHLRPLLGLGTSSRRRMYAEKILHIAFSNPLVMHAILALAKIYESTTNLSYNTKDTVKLTYHWYHAVSLLHHKISQTIIPSERDAIYISGALISIGSFATIEATIPSEAWPLRPPSDLDLSWLKLCDGKKILTQLTDPSREEGNFRESAIEFHNSFDHLRRTIASPTPNFSALPLEFQKLLRLPPALSGDHDHSLRAPTKNPYYNAAVALCEISRLDLCEQNYSTFISFPGVLDEGFRVLLEAKDERALLLLLYWYVKVCDRQLWWIWRQAWTEGLAICEVLGRAWVGRLELLGLLEWPLHVLATAAGDGGGYVT